MLIFTLITFHFSLSKNYFFANFPPKKYTMSHSTNSNVNFCDDFDLSFETKKDLSRQQSYDSKHKELLEKMFGSDDEAPIHVKLKAEKVIPPSSQPIPKKIERVYDSEEEYYFLRPKPKGAPKLRVSLQGLRP